jgi:hypothetical protein
MISFYQQDGYKFFFSPVEGERQAHVHIIGQRGQMIVWLKPLTAALAHNVSDNEQKTMLRIVEENLHDFLTKWTEWYESYSPYVAG